jgi:hypothetical protein
LAATWPSPLRPVRAPAARTLWLAFDAWCDDVGWTDRKQDPEAWDIWLTGRNAASNEALMFEWWEALRASGMATGLRRLTAAAGWQDRSFAIALDLLRSDDAGSLLLVTAADGLTFGPSRGPRRGPKGRAARPAAKAAGAPVGVPVAG